MFDKIDWREDHLLLNDLAFYLELSRDDLTTEQEYFRFYKTKKMVEQFATSFARLDHFQPKNLFELGMWDGGSLAFWHEILKPKKSIGVDIQNRDDSSYFKQYVESRQLHDSIKAYWGVDQADPQRLREIVQQEFGTAPLDLIIDDASHLYEQTKSSFETLFPLLRPGGFYIIEDWSWPHWYYSTEIPFFAGKTPLSKLVLELVEATGSLTGTNLNQISNVDVTFHFVIIERAKDAAPLSDDFKLDDYIYRLPGFFRTPLTLEVLEVVNLCLENNKQFWSGWLDSPKARHISDGYAIYIAGWVIGKLSKVTLIRVSVMDQIVAEIPVNVSRPGVQETYAFLDAEETLVCGYAETVYLIKQPIEGRLELEAIFEDGETAPVGAISYCKY